jgi:phosphoribosylamine--glycine ligase
MESLNTIPISWDPRPALTIVLTAKGYPEKYPTGDVIQGLKAHYSDSQQVFHAGTCWQNQQIISNGGRVLCATALGDTLTDAQRAAYALAAEIHWENMYYRKDIGFFSPMD